MTAMASMVRRIKLGSQGPEVSAQGLGCSRMSRFWGPLESDPDMIKLVHHAVDSGVTFLDTSDARVLGETLSAGANEILLGKALKGGVRQKVELATKFGTSFVEGKWDTRSDPGYVRAACEASLKRLDVDCIDLYYQKYIDTRVPIEVTIGELKKLVEEGKIKYVGLCNASASTIRRAHAVHPVTAVQLDWTLATRDVEAETIPTCRELGIGIVVYTFPEDFCVGDDRVYFRRFRREKLVYTSKLLKEIAQRKGCSRSQLALAWVHHKGDDVCPIPCTTNIGNFNQNIAALSVKLTPEEMAELESIASVVDVKWGWGRDSAWENPETPPLSSWKAA